MRAVISRARVLTVLLLVALTACGSTLQPTQTQLSGATPNVSSDGLALEAPTDGQAPGQGLALETGAGGGVVTGGGTAAPNAAAPGAPGSGTTAPGSTVPGSTAPGSAPAGSGTPGSSGPGRSTPRSDAPGGSAAAGPIRVGAVYTDISALAAVFGSNEDNSNAKAVHRKFVEYLNKTGGIAGRKVELEIVTVDVANDYNAEGQRACEHFTEDSPVDIVLPTEFSNEVLLACLARHGIAAIDTQIWTHDRAHIDHSNWFTPVGMRVDRYATAAIDIFVKAGLLKSGDKLGVLYEDCPWGGRVYSDVVQPAAARHGVTTEQATVKCVENLVADLGPVTNGARSAVLRFRSANVTHVLVLSAAEGFVVGQFSSTASDQRYYPKYALTSNAWPYNNADGGGPVAFARDQLPNMAGIGFAPYRDVGMATRPATQAQAGVQDKCRKVDPSMYGADAYEGGPDKATRLWGFFANCDVYFALQDIGNATNGDLSIPAVASAYTTVLSRRPSAALGSGDFSPASDRRDGTSIVRTFAFSTKANQFTYNGRPRPTS